MNILILGSGGREHAITWKLAQSSRPLKLFVAPGNPGTSSIASNVHIDPLDFEGVRSAIIENRIGMVVVGPEAPLAEGIADFIEADPALAGVAVIGPGRAGAMLEGSKDFAKRFMIRHGIPTAAYETFTPDTFEEAVIFMRGLQPPYVLKADGLAAGKGVLIINDFDEAVSELQSMLGGRFGAAGNKVVIEEYLSGVEMSAFVITDGITYRILPEAKDYKRIGEGDTGKNTGGMGAVSPVPFATPLFMSKVEERIIKPTVEGLRSEGIDYRGFIFFGLMNMNGDPFVIEYNARLGDPESEVILPRIGSDLYDLLEGVAHRDLGAREIVISPETAVTVMMVSGGYPDRYSKGYPITGTEKIIESTVFHAGTAMVDGHLSTSGGRVLAVTSGGSTMAEALGKSYRSIGEITFEGMNYRRDIGFDLKNREG
ncbi:MAG: phosphoribosylamine--glycine ligase [Bacteroidales bacterium]|jgi:phosphoribosylamine--glycine ligase|nr:phosphoribosylamine--glycine ligase [Bacteroidales bacterium]MCB9028134.1 phosphoribosylamine--glycine ligase [Bacteroidales bacterium]MDD3736073.1 phosphoribosylamine--glycine ligase [Bacteroidales bacterium]NLD62821.1 phosphoribosylamine--glycine ligase [Bacteroidales bacterium]HNT92570.1 phosphoribosylamine--glycine ligase [Bacteroidales bacterium]